MYGDHAVDYNTTTERIKRINDGQEELMKVILVENAVCRILQLGRLARRPVLAGTVPVLSVCPVAVSKMSRFFTLVELSILTRVR